MKSVKLAKKMGLFLLVCVFLSLASCVTKPKGDLERDRQYSRDAEAGMNRAFNN